MATIASTEHPPISKELLTNIHRRQLMNGQTNNVHQDAIIDALGGIDDILQHLFTSNVVLHEHQLHSLHRIIASTATTNIVSQSQDDKTPTLSYIFKDADSFLFALFGRGNATKILHMLNGKIIKLIFLLWIAVAVIVTLLAQLSIVSWDVFFVVCTVLYLFSSIFIIMWILYANKEVMKLLFSQFVFWFKICYLFQYLVTVSIVQYLKGDPLYFICSTSIWCAALVLIVIIFDAINIQKSTKIMISSLAVGIFAYGSFADLVNTFYSDQWGVYDRATVTLNIPYVDEKARIYIVDMGSNSMQILAIWLCKQLISIIRNPDQASVITNKPFIKYENNKETIPTMKNLKHWQRATTVGWTVLLILWILLFLLQVLLNEESHIMYISLLLIFVVIFIIGLSVVTIARSKFHWLLHIFLFVDVIIYVILMFLFQFEVGGVVLLLILFGVTAVYTLKVSEMDKMNGSVQCVKQEKEREAAINDLGYVQMVDVVS